MIGINQTTPISTPTKNGRNNIFMVERDRIIRRGDGEYRVPVENATVIKGYRFVDADGQPIGSPKVATPKPEALEEFLAKVPTGADAVEQFVFVSVPPVKTGGGYAYKPPDGELTHTLVIVGSVAASRSIAFDLINSSGASPEAKETYRRLIPQAADFVGGGANVVVSKSGRPYVGRPGHSVGIAPQPRRQAAA